MWANPSRGGQTNLRLDVPVYIDSPPLRSPPERGGGCGSPAPARFGRLAARCGEKNVDRALIQVGESAGEWVGRPAPFDAAEVGRGDTGTRRRFLTGEPTGPAGRRGRTAPAALRPGANGFCFLTGSHSRECSLVLLF